MCEKAKEGRAQVTIVDIASKRKKKTLPEPEMDNLSIECNEFLSCTFSPTLEKEHLVTLSGEGDWCAILWKWDALKILAKVDFSIVDPVEPRSFQISLHPVMGLACVVTGTNTYQFMKVEENFRSFNVVHSELQTGRSDISTDYTCHCWAKDTTQLVVATAVGDILVCNMNGEFVIQVPDSPSLRVQDGIRIDTMVPYLRGLILAGE